MDGLQEKVNAALDAVVRNLATPGAPDFYLAIEKLVGYAIEQGREEVVACIENYGRKAKAPGNAQGQAIAMNLNVLVEQLRVTVPDDYAWKRPCRPDSAPAPKYDGELLTGTFRIGRRVMLFPAVALKIAPSSLPKAKMHAFLN